MQRLWGLRSSRSHWLRGWRAVSYACGSVPPGRSSGGGRGEAGGEGGQKGSRPRQQYHLVYRPNHQRPSQGSYGRVPGKRSLSSANAAAEAEEEEEESSASTRGGKEESAAGNEDKTIADDGGKPGGSTPVPAAPSRHMYTGRQGRGLPFTSSLHMVGEGDFPDWPVYQVLQQDGTLCAGAEEPATMDKALAMRIYEHMIRLREMDTVFYNAQRQGRISFYMTSGGEEGLQMAAAAALDQGDTVFGQYREAGLLMWRGFSLPEVADQLFSNCDDLGKGRQMPMHFGSRALRYHTISSPLATQIPHAVGAAYANKIAGEEQAVICFFGEGAASEGDFHAALNFAATTEAPVIFFCRNNGYAISTPAEEQYRGDGIVSRAPGYGLPGIRVDGNDPLAVFNAVGEARRMAVEEHQPVLIEAMTYRVGHHSTSDDWSRYRPKSEVEQWQQHACPLQRFKAFLLAKGWWDEGRDVKLRDTERINVIRALEEAEAKKKPPLSSLFEEVYSVMPPALSEQRDHLMKHIAKYPHKYPH